MINVPQELDQYFDSGNFEDYPLITIPQKFYDERGTILNLADGKLGDVALIKSSTGAIRANHYHLEDWHLCYVINGKLNYSWKSFDDDLAPSSMEVKSGSLIFTPKLIAHKLEFLEPTSLIIVSKLSRISSKYELDTKKTQI